MTKITIQQLSERLDAVEALLGRLLQTTPQPRVGGAAAWAPDMTAGRWHARDGTVYGRYTYEEGTVGQQLDPQLRRSPPATE